MLAPAGAHAAYPGRNGAIAYVGKVGGVTTLLVRKGSSVRGVLDGPVLASPAWSPGGLRLAVVRSSPEGRDVWIARSGGEDPRQLTTGGDNADPAWAPAGDELAYTEGPRGARHLFVVGADATGLRQLTDRAGADDREPDWSVRGQIAFVRDGDLFTCLLYTSDAADE